MTLDLIRSSIFVRQHAGRTFVLKVGGACLARPRRLRALARQVAVVQALGSRVVLVHGGGPQVSARQTAAGETPRKVGGRRVTTPLALAALKDCAHGLGEQLVAALVEAGASARRLDAVATGSVKAVRREPVVTEEGPVDFGLVGDVHSVDAAGLSAALEEHGIIVLAPPVQEVAAVSASALADRDAGGDGLNVNADTVAAEVAVALKTPKLILATDAAGILSNPADSNSAIGALTLAEMRAYAGAGVLSGGMAVKSRAVERALCAGVERVHLIDGRREDALLVELYTAHGSGTLVTLEQQAAAPAEAGASMAEAEASA